jgi:pyruvate dehydrogenase phosphatase
MLPLFMARTCLHRLTATSTIRTQTKLSCSTKASASNTNPNKVIKYIAIATASASAIGVPGLWWLKNSLVDDVPRFASPPAKHLIIEPAPSKDEVTRIISQEAYSFQVRNIAGVKRYDGAQLASNSPCEDRFTHGIFPSPWNDGNQWMAWAVFDGHAGWQTAALLEKQLLPFVQHSLTQIKSLSHKEPVPVELVQSAIKKAFLNLDDSVINTALETSQSNESLQQKVKKLLPAYAGSCALLSIYDSVTSTLHVACTGDSRAVMGQKKSDGTWEAIALSIDQTGSNEEEVARISKEHPGEENIAKNGRVLGVMVSRAFGDGRWKWPLELQQDLNTKFCGPGLLTPKYDVRTPPYLTAEPVLTATKIDPSKPSFLIMATDGMWDALSNQQAVDLVGKWLDLTEAESRNYKSEPRYEPLDFGQLGNGVDWEFIDRRTTVEDSNAAVHLMRNSLGGNHHELIAGRVAVGYPFSRHIRDDVTVQVVFFNDIGPKAK